MTVRSSSLLSGSLLVALAALGALPSLAGPPTAIGPKFYMRSYADAQGNYQECTSASSPPLDCGAVATSKYEYYIVTNVGDAPAYNLSVTLTGSDVPVVFDDADSYSGSFLAAGRSVWMAIRFHPPADDPSGTTYGGVASRAVITVRGTAKPGGKQPPIVLPWVVQGRKL